MASMYQATPLEQVYSLFLAQQVFGIPPSNGSIQIPGRDAVPFLTQSNVDRGVLRSLWSVADPDNVGTLTQIRQFQVLLRLVSMAQAGLLGPQMTVETVKLMIPQYSTQQLPLAVFSSVIIPHQDQLMNAYSNFIVHKQIQTTITPSSSITPVTSNQGGFWSLSQYSSPPLVGNYSSTGGISTGFGQRTTSQGSFGSGSFGHQQQQHPPPPQPTKQPMTVSISDAFSDLGPPADAPLPSLINETTSETSSNVPSNPTVLNDAPTPSNGMSTPYGDMPTNTYGSGGHPTVTTTGGNMSVSDTFGNMPHTAPHQTLSSVGDSSAASTVPVTAAFDALGESQDAPLPSLSQAAPSAVPPQDEFGGFENAVLGASHNAAPTPSPFGHQGGGSISAYNNVSSNNGPKDGFGGFETGATTNVQHNVLEESDPFGSLAGNSQDAPLPSLDGSQAPVASQNDGDDDDGFGGFETATQTSNIRNFPAADDADPFGSIAGSHDAPLPSLDGAQPPVASQNENGGDDFGGFETATHTSNSRSFPASGDDDPFGSIAGSQNAPLPSLDGTQPPMASQNDTDDDDFGGFESATHTSNDMQVPAAGDVDPFGPLAGSHDAPLPSLAGTQPPMAAQNDDDDDFGGFETATVFSNDRSAPAPDESDPFGSIAGSHDAPLPSLDGSQPPVASQHGNDNDFGGFETATHFSNDKSAPAPDESDPFGSIAGSHDAPLPSLDGSQPPVASQNDDDDFGGFETATGVSIGGSAPAADESDPFGPLAGSQDTPLPSLHGTQPPVASQHGDDDDFGGFETATHLSNEKNASAADESDPFGSIASSHDAPLPSLHGTQPPVASQHGDGDDFGGFETATHSSKEKNASAADESDPFGSIASSHDAPLPSLDGTQPPVTSQNDDGDDDFGGFETATAVSNGGDAPAADEADPFGPLAGTQDAPLPSLDGAQPPVASQNDDDDDFGGFETATHTSNDKDVDQFGSIGGSQGAPLRSLDGTQPHVAPQNDDDDFGGFESADNPATTNAPGGQQNATYRSSASLAESSAASTIPMSAAFDALGEVQDAPLQSMHQSMKPSPQQETDDFGGFENAVLGASNNAAPMPVSDQDDADFGDFADAAFPVQNDSVAVESDPFGPLAGIQDTPLPSWNGPPQVEQQQTDHFGDFASPSAGNIAQGSDVFGPRNGEQDPSAGDPSDSRNVPASEPESGEHKEDEFGGFADAAATNLNAPNEVIETPFSEEQQQQVDDFGDFEDVSFPNTETEKTDSKVHGETDGFTGDSTSSNPAKSTDDEWGAFGSGIAAANAPSSSNSNEGEFGAFNAPTNPSPVETSDDDEWGEFDSGMSSEPPAKAIEKSNPNDGAFGDFGAPTNPPEETNGDDWGAFDSGVASSAPTTGDRMSNPPTSSSNGADDDWGAFDSVDASTEKAISSPQEPADDDDWGAFDNAEPVTTSTEDLDAFSKEQQTTPADDDFGDFGDFEGAETVGPAAVENEMQGKVRGLSFQLPETLLRKSGMSGEHVDLGECFEVNIGLELDLDVSKKNRFER
eukprot:scaffold2927_cov143-Cylindrotheca_fusiformis.AAC.8